MKTKTRIIITVCFLILFFSAAFAYRSCHQKPLFTQTEIGHTDDGTIVFCYEDDKGNEYIKFGDNPIEKIQ